MMYKEWFEKLGIVKSQLEYMHGLVDLDLQIGTFCITTYHDRENNNIEINTYRKDKNMFYGTYLPIRDLDVREREIYNNVCIEIDRWKRNERDFPKTSEFGCNRCTCCGIDFNLNTIDDLIICNTCYSTSIKTLFASDPNTLLKEIKATIIENVLNQRVNAELNKDVKV